MLPACHITIGLFVVQTYLESKIFFLFFLFCCLLPSVGGGGTAVVASGKGDHKTRTGEIKNGGELHDRAIQKSAACDNKRIVIPSERLSPSLFAINGKNRR